MIATYCFIISRSSLALMGEYTLRWTKNGTCGIHNCIFSKKLIQMFGVLGM
jgi:hypothetical protein